MSSNSKIEWTERTWNPVAGCFKVSQGCKHCYAIRNVHRMAGNPNPAIREAYRGLTENIAGSLNWTGVVRALPDRLMQPLSWKKPSKVFVNSLSDLFHKDLPVQDIKRIFEVMNRARQHSFQILTKRSENLVRLSPELTWSENIWMGVSVEDGTTRNRVVDLRNTGAKVKFLSLEPLLGPLPDLDLSGIDWVIVGGESGTNARRMSPEWARDLRDQCVKAGVPFFFKQWGEHDEFGVRVGKKKAGRILDGRTWDEMPGLPENNKKAA